MLLFCFSFFEEFNSQKKLKEWNISALEGLALGRAQTVILEVRLLTGILDKNLFIFQNLN